MNRQTFTKDTKLMHLNILKRPPKGDERAQQIVLLTLH